MKDENNSFRIVGSDPQPTDSEGGLSIPLRCVACGQRVADDYVVWVNSSRGDMICMCEKHLPAAAALPEPLPPQKAIAIRSTRPKK